MAKTTISIRRKGMSWMQKIVIIFSIFRSKRFIVLCLATLALLVAFILLGVEHSPEKRYRHKLSNWFKDIYKKEQHRMVDISSISWVGRESPIKLLNHIVTDREKIAARKKEQVIIRLQLSKHKKYVQSYTSCLSRRFKNFEKNSLGQKIILSLVFGDMMETLHKDCNKELFGISGNKCQYNRSSTVGNLLVKRKPLEVELLKKKLPDVRLGGVWGPTDCVPKAKLAVIIPFRSREDHLLVLLRQLHPILQKQNILYRIFVIEQADEYPFNRGKLMNVGFNEAIKMFNFDCFVFHDVDLIPENDRIDYGCPSSPRHMSAAIDKFGYNLPYHGLFGGIEMFTKTHFKMVNGFRNSYWGWGAEDDDLYRRIVKVGLRLTRPRMDIGRYSMIKHSSSEKPPDRMDKLQMAESSITTDGLLSLLYKVLLIKEHSLYTVVRVDLKMEGDMVH